MDLEIPQDALPNDEDTGFELLPDGRYQASVYKAEEKTFSTGTKGIHVDFIITAGDYEGRHVFDNFFTSPRAIWKLAKLMQAAGYELPKGGGTVKNFRPSAMVGKPVQIKVGKESRGERSFNKVEFVDPPPGGAKAMQKTGFAEL